VGVHANEELGAPLPIELGSRAKHEKCRVLLLDLLKIRRLPVQVAQQAQKNEHDARMADDLRLTVRLGREGDFHENPLFGFD
jgi:hypothetical protein